MRKLLVDQNISNFDLVVAMKTMQGNPTMETQQDFINHMLHARLLCPAILDPEPEISEEGELELGQGTKIMFNTVANSDKQVFIIAYTDKKEAEKCRQDEKQHTIVTTYVDFCNIILQQDSPYTGFVINPFSENIIFTREIMLDINKNIRVEPRNPDEAQAGQGIIQ